jgi:hypothetical protein
MYNIFPSFYFKAKLAPMALFCKVASPATASAEAGALARSDVLKLVSTPSCLQDGDVFIFEFFHRLCKNRLNYKQGGINGIFDN